MAKLVYTNDIVYSLNNENSKTIDFNLKTEVNKSIELTPNIYNNTGIIIYDGETKYYNEYAYNNKIDTDFTNVNNKENQTTVIKNNAIYYKDIPEKPQINLMMNNDIIKNTLEKVNYNVIYDDALKMRQFLDVNIKNIIAGEKNKDFDINLIFELPSMVYLSFKKDTGGTSGFKVLASILFDNVTFNYTYPIVIRQITINNKDYESNKSLMAIVENGNTSFVTLKDIPPVDDGYYTVINEQGFKFANKKYWENIPQIIPAVIPNPYIKDKKGDAVGKKKTGKLPETTIKKVSDKAKEQLKSDDKGTSWGVTDLFNKAKTEGKEITSGIYQLASDFSNFKLTSDFVFKVGVGGLVLYGIYKMIKED